MNKLKRLRDRKAALKQQMEAYNEKNAENWGEEQEKEWETFQSDLAEVDAAIAREEELQEIERSMTPVADGNQDTQDEADLRIGNPRQASLDDPMKGFKSPREFFQSVIAASTGSRLDERLAPLQAAGSDEHSTQNDAYGGFLVPEAMSPDFLTTDPEPDPLLGRLQNIPMDAPVVKIPARVDKNHSTSVSGGLSVSRRMETGTGTSSRMQTEQVRLEAQSLFGLTYVTEELLTDSPRSLAALLDRGFRDEFTSHMIDERINGTGAGEHLGILNSPCLISVAKEAAQAADTINGTNIVKMRSRCWHYSNAIWLANPDVYEQLVSVHIAGTNADVFLFNPSRGTDVPDMLLGRPIIFTEYAKTLGDQGDLILGVWSEYLDGVYQPLNSAESVHVRFLNHERTFKLWTRNAGAPWWKTALTPKNSSQTLSPFVVLDERA